MLKQIGTFSIIERVGRGTYSRVYRATSQQGRPVAIKISTTPTEQEHLSEFQRDLVAAASVLHPNLVSVHDLGFKDDFPYVVMELVEGSDVGKLIQTKAQVSLGERIQVMLQVGEALKSAHERGVFHLDVRPSKIMLNGEGAAKLLGLGLGRLSYDESRVTDRGYLIGSPFYMSPERLTAVETADAQCDIWSFGVTFHEWISGRHPFFHEDGNRMIGNIMDNAPADLAGVTGSLHRLIRQTLEKDPGSRYRNFAELIADLKPIARELQRDESDAMLAEALKQTDSGQWYEARRIAREMRADKPAKPAASQFFGVPQPGAETDQIPEPTGIPVNPPLAAAAAVGASSGPRPIVETPPAPVPVPPPTLRESKPEFNPAKPLFEDGGSQLPVPIPRPTVRILAAEESSGFPLGKVAAFAVAAMLVAGVLLFLWGPYSGVVGKGELSAEAKAINPPGNVVKANRDVADVSPATTALDDDSALAQPRPFDPKSLTASKSIPTLPVRLRPNTTATLKPPPLSQSTLIGDLVVWPGAVKAPPPPAPAPAALVVNNPPAEKPRPQSAEAAQAAAVRVGGSFSQPVLVHSVPPAYPPSALERKAQGVVRFEATITKDGSVANLQVVSGDPLLDVAAKNAVLQWKYQPALLNGEPVEVTQSIVVKFNLSQ